MATVAERSTSPTKPDVRALEQFLFYEAQLLDSERLDEWAALFTEEGEYWVPASPNQPDPINHVSIIYEKNLLRSIRVKRFSSPNAFSLEPKPRSVHLISNVILESHDESMAEILIASKFIMLQRHRDNTRLFGGTYTHTLRVIEGGYKIACKKVQLIDCDGAQESILLFF